MIEDIVVRRLTDEQWKAEGLKQLVLLKQQGLLPEHELLEIGCGDGKAARVLIRYLDDARYVGLDAAQGRIYVAIKLAEKESLHWKHPVFWCTDAYTLPPWLDKRFDFVWSYSVFSHFVAEQMVACIRAVVPVLTEDAVFLMTANLGKRYEDQGPHPHRPNERKKVIYPLEVIQDAVAEVADVEVVPSKLTQSVLRFYPKRQGT